MSLPPRSRKRARSGLSVPMTAPNCSTDCLQRSSNPAGVSVVQSHCGFWSKKKRNHSRGMMNGFPVNGEPLVLARAEKSVPRARPYHRNFPSCPLGPSQILRTTSASASVNVLSPTLVPTSVLGSYVHLAGSSMTPSLTPSKASQAATAAAVAASSLDFGRKFFASSMTT